MVRAREIYKHPVLAVPIGETGIEVIELMPPAVKTDLAAHIAEGDVFTLMTTDELVKQSFASLKAGALARIDAANAGRAYAAYGGIYILSSYCGYGVSRTRDPIGGTFWGLQSAS